MTWDYQAVNDIVDATTTIFRKGEEVTKRTDGALRVTEVMAYPHVDEAPSDLIDVHFFAVAIDKDKANEMAGDLKDLLARYPQPERLARGPSYIEVGGELWDQGHALCLFALGQFLGLWKVITPKTFGVTGPDADEMAGQGMVMCSGWKP